MDQKDLKEAEEALSRCRVRGSKSTSPVLYFHSLAYKFPPKLGDSPCGTAHTDGRSITIDPTFFIGKNPDIKLTSDSMRDYVIAHEVLHIALCHPSRLRGRKHDVWNIACDMLIHHMLSQVPTLTAPDGCVTPPPQIIPKIDEWGADGIYDWLEKQPQKSGGKSRKGQPQPGTGKGQSQGTGKEKTQYGTPFDEMSEPPEAPGDKRDAADERTRATAKAFAEQIVRSCGNVPAWLQRIVGAVLDNLPSQDWRRILRQFVQSARSDYDWRKPSRRHLWRGAYLPSLHSEKLGKIVMALDASGSVGNQEIAEMSVELMDILALRQDSLRVLWFDTQVASDQEIEYGDDATALRPAGGGGTDFIAPFAHLEEEGTQPECVVLLTDGECASYPDLPPYPVIWGVVKNGRKDFDPPFGRVLYLD